MICTTKDCLDNIGDNNKDFKYGCVAWGDDAPKQCKDYRADSSVNVDQRVSLKVADIVCGNCGWKGKEEDLQNDFYNTHNSCNDELLCPKCKNAVE